MSMNLVSELREQSERRSLSLHTRELLIRAADAIQHYKQLEADGRLIELQCKPGEKLYVLSERQYQVGNDYENPCDDCELYEHYTYEFGGREYETCKTSFDCKCPTVVKPITVELFEVCDNQAIPCYHVAYEGNSEIRDWHPTREEAEAALSKGSDKNGG